MSNLLKSLVFVALIFGAFPYAVTAQVTAKLPRIAISNVSSSEFSDNCSNLLKLVKTTIAAQRRFKPGRSKSVFKLEVNCAADKVAGDLSVVGDGKKFYRVASITMPVRSKDAFAQKSFAAHFWYSILSEVGWDGEISSVVEYPPSSAESYKKDQLRLIARANLTMSSNTTLLIATCFPVDVGSLRHHKGGVSFQRFGTGLVREVGQEYSTIDIYSKDSALNPQNLYVAGIADPARISPDMEPFLKDCFSNPAPPSPSGLFEDMFGKDFIEVNDVQQRYGVALLTASGSSNAKAPLVASGYVYNRLHFGDRIFVEAFGLRSMYSKPYQSIAQTSGAPKPEITLAHGFLGGRGLISQVEMTFGLGLVLEKVNIPYTYPSGSSQEITDYGNRTSSARPSMILGAEYSVDRWTLSLKLPVASSKESYHLETRSTILYRLSSTWLTGLDVMHVTSKAKTQEEPDAVVFGLGTFLGVQVGQ